VEQFIHSEFQILIDGSIIIHQSNFLLKNNIKKLTQNWFKKINTKIDKKISIE